MRVSLALKRYAEFHIRARKLKSLRLPPGHYNPFGSGEVARPDHFLTRYRRYGPVYKTSWARHVLICIVGIERSRQFLKEHEDSLSGISQDLTALFEGEDIRNLPGDEHRVCKQHLAAVVAGADPGALENEIRSFIKEQLQNCTAEGSTGAFSVQTLKRTLDVIATGSLLTLLLDVVPGTGSFSNLYGAYHRYGPDGIEWDIGPAQIEAFREIEAAFESAAHAATANASNSGQGCRFEEIASRYRRDPQVLGNLIQMIEMGRHDIAALLRWIVSLLNDNSRQMRERFESTRYLSDASYKLAKSTVLETLRLVQSEALVRRVESDIHYAGYLIPKNSFVRICLWEAHKDPDMFADPFRFEPGRFLNNPPGAQSYAPFGLGRHRCIAGDIVLRIASLFVEELMHGFTWTEAGNGPPVLRSTLWEPSPDFSVRLEARGDRKT